MYGELIDVALKSFEWQQREVTFRVFLRAIRCINLGQGHNQTHFLLSFRAGLLLAVSAKYGPIPISIESIERAAMPTNGPSLKLFRAAKNGARASIVSAIWNNERQLELCLADASDAESQEAQYYERIVGNALISEMAIQQFKIDLDNRDALAPGELLERPLWSYDKLEAGIQSAEMKENMQRFGALELTAKMVTGFWREWMYGFLDGKPLDWELQRRVALIKDDIWEAGPEAVAEKIERIRAAYGKEKTASGAAPEPKPVTESEKSAIAQRVMINRDALAVSVAGLLEQLSTFKERVRGLNHLDPEFREELLTFIDSFSGQLESLLSDLPMPGEKISDDKANRLALWLRDYKTALHTKLAHYASPDNMAEATVPTSIVLAATGVGALCGYPLAGSVVGGLIANKMNPGQAAKELLKPTKPETDPDGG